MMDGKQYTYDAFISYRHIEKDRYAAELLQKKLEGFRLPKNIRKKNGAEGKERITRIFRDTDELPLTSNLADPITEALRTSEFLIVICSPKLRESLWCRTEIEAFIRMHGREHILAVLVEGEPGESFPEEILYREEAVQENGSTVIKRIPLEPLAADVRGESKRAVRKKMKSEILRLAAPMFGCGYDDLRQRHRERRLKRIAAAALAGGAVCLSFGAVSTAMALRISLQNERIEAQSREIGEQSEEIHARYVDALRTNSVIMAENALDLLDEGDRMTGAEMAFRALPPVDGTSDIPYTPQAQYALTECLYVYENGGRLLPQHMLVHDAEVDFMLLSPGRERILTCDRFNRLTVWDAMEGKKLCEIPAGESMRRTEENTRFLTDRRLLFPGGDGYEIYDIETGRTSGWGIDWLLYATADRTGQKFLVSDRERVKVCGTQDGAALFTCEDAEGREFGGASCFNEDGTLFAAEVSGGRTGKEENAKNAVLVFDAATGQLLHEYPLPGRQVERLLFAGDILYSADHMDLTASAGTEAGMLLYGQGEGRLCAFDLNTYDGTAWSCSHPDGWIYDIVSGGSNEENVVLSISYDSVDMINSEDGSLLDSTHYGTEVKAVAPTDGGEVYLVFTRDGEYHFLDTRSRSDFVSAGMFQSNSDNVKGFLYGDGFCALLPYGDGRITIFQQTLASRAEEILSLEETVEYVRIDRAASRLLVMEYGNEYREETVSLYDARTAEPIRSFPVPESAAFAKRMDFAGDNDEYFFLETDSHTVWCDAKTGEFLWEEERDADAAKARFGADCSQRSVTAAGEKYFAAADPETGILSLYDGRKGKKEISISAARVSALFFDGREERLFATFENNEIQVYDTGELSLLHTFTGLKEEMKESVCRDGLSFSILKGETHACMIDEDMELLADIRGFQDVDAVNRFFYVSRGNTVYRIPIYDLHMLKQDYERLAGQQEGPAAE